MIPALRYWGVRLVIPVAVSIGIVLLAYALELSGLWFLAAFTIILFLQLAAVELLRPGGSWPSTGIACTPAMPMHIVRGVFAASGGLAVIAGASVGFGGRFHFAVTTASISTVATLVLGSVMEELLFRGTMFEALRERFGAKAAIGVTSVLFGFAHGMNPGVNVLGIMNVVLAGILLGAMVAEAQSLWQAITFHVFWNLLVRAFFGVVSGAGSKGWLATLDTSGMQPSMRWLIDGSFGIEQGLVTTVVLLVALFFTAAFPKPDRTVVAARWRRDRWSKRTVSPLPKS